MLNSTDLKWCRIRTSLQFSRKKDYYTGITKEGVEQKLRYAIA